jgi:hypothetical protein
VVVPIESLFYDDAGPHILTTGRRPTPRGSALHALLATGIAGLEQLDTEPFSPPVEIDDALVPIEDLLYRGRAALDRALEVRGVIRARGGAATQDEIEEIFDLIELAAHEPVAAE